MSGILHLSVGQWVGSPVDIISRFKVLIEFISSRSLVVINLDLLTGCLALKSLPISKGGLERRKIQQIDFFLIGWFGLDCYIYRSPEIFYSNINWLNEIFRVFICLIMINIVFYFNSSSFMDRIVRMIRIYRVIIKLTWLLQ